MINIANTLKPIKEKYFDSYCKIMFQVSNIITWGVCVSFEFWLLQVPGGGKSHNV